VPDEPAALRMTEFEDEQKFQDDRIDVEMGR
jgi:hypothetical protein